MCDDDIHAGLVEDQRVSRRTFGLAAAAAAAAGGVATAASAQAKVVEKDVEVRTADGTADAALYHPEGRGTWPAVLMWPDVLSLRPAFRDMGRRLAAQGYVVLVPNVYYRARRAPIVDGSFNFSNPEDRAKIAPFRAALTPEAIDGDAAAYVAFLDAQPQTNRRKGVGVQGYCMGGPISVRTAAAVPGRIRAVATFHSGALVTEEPTSPHLLIPRTQAAYLILTAENDDKQRPQEKDQLKALFAEAGRPGAVEVYPAAHGWCVKGSQVYDEAQAERAWAALLAHYKAHIA